MSRTILRIDSSVTGPYSATRALTDQLVEKLAGPDDTVLVRDLETGVPHLDSAIVANMAVAPEERSAEAASALALADQLIAELKGADVLVIGAPMYNFTIPSNLKAWADLVSQVGKTFEYTETGANGLAGDRPTYIVAASGGMPIGSPGDFGTTWLQGFLAFLGITSVEVIAADGMAIDREAGMAAAGEAIAAVA